MKWIYEEVLGFVHDILLTAAGAVVGLTIGVVLAALMCSSGGVSSLLNFTANIYVIFGIIIALGMWGGHKYIKGELYR